MPVYDEVGEIERYNAFHASLIVRYSEDKKLYLYDILNIKKKRATRLSHKAVHDKNPFLYKVMVLYEMLFVNLNIRKTVRRNGVLAIVLVGMLFLSDFSIKQDVLSNYNVCQIIMLVILLSQWLGEQLLGNKTNNR